MLPPKKWTRWAKKENKLYLNIGEGDDNSFVIPIKSAEDIKAIAQSVMETYYDLLDKEKPHLYNLYYNDTFEGRMEKKLTEVPYSQIQEYMDKNVKTKHELNDYKIMEVKPTI
jgi:hypothetical protein